MGRKGIQQLLNKVGHNGPLVVNPKRKYKLKGSNKPNKSNNKGEGRGVGNDFHVSNFDRSNLDDQFSVCTFSPLHVRDPKLDEQSNHAQQNRDPSNNGSEK